MKTFFCFSIIANGERTNIQIQSTKLTKIGETRNCGIYVPKESIMCGGYEFEFKLFLTYTVEMCGTIGAAKKQKRYTLHKVMFQTYKRDKYQMLLNVMNEVSKVFVSIRETDLIEEGTIIIRDKR